MVEETVFGGIINFLGRLGFYDVILPFLLVFTLIYAILDKTRILGNEPGEGDHPRRNLNSIIAFVTAFIFISAKELVAIVNQAVANIAVLAVLGVFMMILFGLFYQEGEFDFAKKHKNWFKFMVVFMGVGVFLIFLHALTWDKIILDFFLDASDLSEAVSAVVFLALVALFIYFVSVYEPSDDDDNDEEEE